MPTRAQFKNLADRLTNQTFADFRVSYTLESPTTTPDGQGGFTVAWTPIATIEGFAKIKSAKQGQLDDHIKHDYDVRFMFEYLDGITDKLRIVYDGEVYNILSVEPVMEVDVWLNVYAKRAVAT